MAFYRFARRPTTSPTIPTSPPEEKLRAAERMRAILAGAPDDDARRRRRCATSLAERGLDRRSMPSICCDAFRRDVTKLRYRRLGRPHGLLPLFGRAGRAASCSTSTARRATTWPPSDALCARAAGDQPPAGLRQGLPRARPRLSAAATLWRRRRAPDDSAAARRRRRLRAVIVGWLDAHRRSAARVARRFAGRSGTGAWPVRWR